MSAAPELVRLTLGYRAPLAWDTLLAMLKREAVPGVTVVHAGSYSRAVALEGKTGVVAVENAGALTDTARAARNHLNVRVSPSLLPVLMPLLARLRQLFDLDAEPAAIDAHLTQGGLGSLVTQRRGLRVPGALDGFEVILLALLGHVTRGMLAANPRVRRVVSALGASVDTGFPSLTRLMPSAARVAEAGGARLTALGVPRRRAYALTAVASAVAEGRLRLEPGADVVATRRAIMSFDGIGDRLATTIVTRALYWPDAFPSSNRALQRSAECLTATQLSRRADRWRPWRAYAALHLWLQDAAERNGTIR